MRLNCRVVSGSSGSRPGNSQTAGRAMRYQSRSNSNSSGESIAKRSLRPLPCSMRSSMRSESMSDTISGAQRGLILRPGGRLQQPCDLLQAQDHRDLARLPHEREVPCHLGAVERHGEEETQRRNRAIDARRTHAGLRLMQLEKAKILRRGRIRRAAEKGCERPDVPDIVVARLLDEVAHRHVFDHASAQRADGLITHRGAPVLRWRLIDPLDSQDRTPGLSPAPAYLVTSL